MKIGLFFGSFNPVHTGHLIIANHMVEYTDLKQVWFVISPQNPFKKKESLLNEYDRLHLVDLAIEGNNHLKSSSLEFSLPKPSFTIDTLTYLKEKYPKHKFSLIMGSDNLATLHKWKNYEQLLKEHPVYIYVRNDFSIEQIESLNLPFLKESSAKITYLDAPLLNISSTFIRTALKEKKSIQYLVPHKIYEYINEMNLYKTVKKS